MKLIISEMEDLRKYVSREFYYVLQELVEKHGWKQFETVRLWKNSKALKAQLRDEFGEMPETILFWESYDFINTRAEEILALDCRKAIFADDLHSWDEAMKRRKRIAYLMCDTVFAAYAYAVEEFFPNLSRLKKVVWIPHAASPDFVLPFNERAENAVLLSGAVNDHYPLRQRVKLLYDAQTYPIAYHPHPGYHCGYDYERDDRVGRGYASKLNRYLTGFADSPRYGYVVAKYFEIPATGSLLLADASVGEHFGRLGFIDGVHYVSVTSENLEERLAYVLDERHREEVDEIRRVGQALVWQRHRTCDRARRIDEVCGL